MFCFSHMQYVSNILMCSATVVAVTSISVDSDVDVWHTLEKYDVT